MSLNPIPPKAPGQLNFDFLQWLWSLFQNLNDGFRPGLGDRAGFLASLLDRL